MRKKLILISLLLIAFSASSQTIEQSFGGQWAMTWWHFEFKKDGTFIRTSTGHYGNPTFEGTYRITGDTIKMLSGYENTHGTVSELYLIDNDSMLVDLTLFYDYSPNAKGWVYNSKKRTDILFVPSEY